VSIEEALVFKADGTGEPRAPEKAKSVCLFAIPDEC